MSKGSYLNGKISAILLLSGETESVSAGTQPDEGYPGLRCAKGESGLRLRTAEAAVASSPGKAFGQNVQ